MENISSATKKIEFDKESGIDRSLLQVIQVGKNNYTKYIFVGEVEENIRKILNKFENFITPNDLNKREKDMLEDFFGLNWDRKLGFNNLQKFKFLPIGDKPESLDKCRENLFSYNINNLESGYNWIKRNYDNPYFYTIASSIYKVYGSNDIYYEDKVIKKKYVNYKIYTDDTIKIIKKKIMLVTKQKKTMLPEMQFLWYYSNSNNFVSLSYSYFFQKNHLLKLVLDPYENLIVGYKDAISDNILSSEYKINYKNEHILLDFPSIKSNIIYVTNIIDVIDYARENQYIDDDSNFINMFILKYWPMLSSTSKILRYVKNPQINVDFNDVNNFIKNQKVIKNEGKIISYLENMEIELKEKIPCLLMQIYFHVNEESRKLGNRFLDLEKVFYFLSPNENMVFISFASYNYTRDHEYIYKINSNILGETNKIIRIYEEWIAKERELKENSLTIKLTDNWKSFLTIKIYEDGYYKIITNWQEEEETSIKDVDSSLKIVKELFQKMNSWDIYQPKKRKNSIILPDLKFLNNPNTNTIIHNMEVHILFNIKEKINYDELLKILDVFKPYISIVKVEDDISKYWKKKDMGNVIDIIRKKGLLNMKKLKDMKQEEWNNLKLFSEKDVNSLQVRNFKQFIDDYRQTSTSFIYKRFSDFYNKKRIFKYISELVVLYGYKTNEVCENVNNSQISIIKEVINKFGGTLDDIRNHIAEWCEINSDEGRRSSGGIKCTIQEIKDSGTNYRIKIQGLRNFTGSSDITRLIRKIYFLLIRLINIYKLRNKYNKDAFFKQISKLDIDYDSLETEDEKYSDKFDNIYNDTDELDDLDDLGKLDDIDINDIQFVDNNDLDLDDFNETVSSNTNTSKNLDVLFDEIIEEYETDTKSKNEQEQIKNKGEYRLGNLLNKDYELFKKYPKQKKSYAQQCQPSYRQPIVLSKEEYNKIDKSKLKLPKDAKEGFLYRGNYYICPEIWCDNMKQVITEKDLIEPIYRDELSKDGKVKLKKIISGKCPDGEEAIIVKDWKAKGYNPKKDTEGRDEYPGFLSPTLHPEGLCVPCCMSTDQSNSTVKGKMFNSCIDEEYKNSKINIEVSEQKLRYIFKESKLLEENRFGLINSSLNSIINNNKKILDSTIKDNFNSLLRVGIQKLPNSFLECIRKIYNLYIDKNLIKDEKEFRNYIANNLKNEKLFLSLNNGNLKNIFTDNFFEFSK